MEDGNGNVDFPLGLEETILSARIPRNIVNVTTAALEGSGDLE